MIKPSLRGMTPHGLGGLAFTLQITAVAGFVLIGMMILMQIRLGGAGRKNGDGESGVKTSPSDAVAI